jgi:hypothetical protein
MSQLYAGLPTLARSSLSNDVRVSVPSESNGRGSAPLDGEGVLSNLPRKRPQRSSARRTAARGAPAPTTGATTEPVSRNGGASAKGKARAKTASKAPAKAKRTPAGSSARTKAKPAASSSQRTHSTAKRPPSTASAEEIPRQGFETESDRARGPVQPPGGAELVAGAVEIVGELAKAGFSTGERLLKDVLSRLPLA